MVCYDMVCYDVPLYPFHHPSLHFSAELSTAIEPWVMAQPAPLPILFDNSLAQSVLGIEFRGTKDMVEASVRTLLDNGRDGKAK